MKKRNWALISVISIAIVGLCVWAVTENVHKNRYRRLLDGMYERSFYSLIDNMENIKVKLEKLLIAQDTNTGNRLIADIWRQSYSVSENISQIPAGAGGTEEIMAFVNKLGEYCRSLSYKEDITEEDKENLRSLLAACRTLSESAQMLRLSSIEGAYALSQPLTDEGEYPIDGIAMNGIDYPTLIYDGPFSDAATGRPLGLPGNAVGVDEAKENAVRFIGEDRIRTIEQTGEEEGEIPTWVFTVSLNSNLVVQAAITKQGGVMLWMLPDSIPANVNLQVNDAVAYSDHFLSSKGLDKMEMIHWQTFGSTVLVTYADVMYDMLIYPDMVKVQVSLDTGEIIGYEAGNYIRSHRLRGYPDMLVTEEAALEAAGEELESKEVRLCLIPMNATEIACYEVKGEFEGNIFYVYVDTVTGKVVNVLKYVSTENGSLTL